MSIILKNQTADGLHRALAPFGVNERTARRIQGALFRTGMIPEAMPEVPAKILSRVRENCIVPRLVCREKLASQIDGFAKYLFSGDGDGQFEAVLIPLNRADGGCVVCVSSQVGCAVGCAFCRTGRLGFVRDLAPWEIVDQVMHIRDDAAVPVRGVVFMGMGEPMLNLDAVLTAARIMSEPCALAIAGKNISISTSGIVPGIERLAQENLPYRLVVSLSSADSSVRRKIIPSENAYPTELVIDSLRKYHEATNQRVTLAWTMIAGVNTAEKDAKELSSLIRGLPVTIDLIDVNDPDGVIQPPDEEELNRFRDFLRAHCGVPVNRRYSGGKDILAACGLLAGKGQNI